MMSTGKTTLFYSFLIMVASLAVGMVIASRLDLTPASSAQGTVAAAPPMNSAPLSGPVDASTFRNIAKAMSPAVVNIRSTSKQRAQEMTEFFGGGGGGNDDLLERFFGGGRARQQPPQQRAARAGNAGRRHRLRDQQDARLHPHQQPRRRRRDQGRGELLGEDSDVYHEAKIVGRDPLTDSALHSAVDRKQPICRVKFGDSSQMQPGDWVMAIGNPFGLAHTVSVGVISATRALVPDRRAALRRRVADRRAINPGNSGGPLLNARGEVVGINTAIYTDSRQQGNIGIGFAIPINSVRELIPQLQTGRVSRGVIGVSVTPIPAERSPSSD
jgi:serine protease Do